MRAVSDEPAPERIVRAGARARRPRARDGGSHDQPGARARARPRAAASRRRASPLMGGHVREARASASFVLSLRRRLQPVLRTRRPALASARRGLSHDARHRRRDAPDLAAAQRTSRGSTRAACWRASWRVTCGSGKPVQPPHLHRDRGHHWPTTTSPSCTIRWRCSSLFEPQPLRFETLRYPCRRSSAACCARARVAAPASGLGAPMRVAAGVDAPCGGARDRRAAARPLAIRGVALRGSADEPVKKSAFLPTQNSGTRRTVFRRNSW